MYFNYIIQTDTRQAQLYGVLVCNLQPISVQCVDLGFLKHDLPVHETPVMIRR